MASMRSLLFRESEWLSPNGRGGDLFSVMRVAEWDKIFNEKCLIDVTTQKFFHPVLNQI